VQEMVYLKGYPKNSPQWTFLCREPSIKKRIWKNKFRGEFTPLIPSPVSAYAIGGPSGRHVIQISTTRARYIHWTSCSSS